ncbi:hypothetical protein BsWGS_08704 [Bradybaena similaris]
MMIHYWIAALVISFANGNHVIEWLYAHNRARNAANAFLTPLVWRNYLEAEAEWFVEQCCTTDEKFRELNTIMFLNHDGYTGSPNQSIYTVTEQRWDIRRGGNVSSCCNAERRLCCHYAMLTSPDLKYVGCHNKVCPLLLRGIRHDITDGYIAVCHYGF